MSGVKDLVAGVNSLHAIEYPGTGNSSVKAHGNQIKVSFSQSLFCKKYQKCILSAHGEAETTWGKMIRSLMGLLHAAFRVWSIANACNTVLNFGFLYTVCWEMVLVLHRHLRFVRKSKQRSAVGVWKHCPFFRAWHVSET